ncbi:hypothetical protein N900_16085 [Vibrio cholerae O1 str. KW3]|nr:hypothetical protein N900_16085 [Vibrio cholerae O1 str. KW3]
MNKINAILLGKISNQKETLKIVIFVMGQP